ncbi:hypothetical protein [Flagellimonas nanhaiensis]|uniref:Uncharacterized protein n=1 Tax=Flagellimonas nanhaiensis TaxID=2292706 RepID=A0A371JSP8_9FLAO|nr:hypothetical protein [Allomuricauda nanhaiensis]RDY60843.1 hypothetical protein DX873_01285 [Allomuricauda nanhaiensis]
MAPEIYDFLKEHYFVPFYLLTWIISVLTYRRYFDTALKYFPMFIAYTFFTELLGYFIKYHEEFQFFSDDRYSWRNIIIYNIYQVVTFLFFYWVYWRVLKSKTYKKWVKYGAVVAMFSYAVSLFFQNPFYVSLYYADVIGSLVLLMCIILYFKEKRMETNPYPQKHNLLFWVSVGTFIFYLLAPYIWLTGYLRYDIWVTYYFWKVLIVLIMIMYSLFIIGLLMGKRKAFR